MKLDKKSLLLYAVTDRRWLGDSSLYDDVKKALDGGVTFVQLREKHLDHDSFLQEAFKIKKLCAEYKVPFVIDDDVQIAKESNADGVHIGQDDMALENARRILGEDSIIGVSAQTVDQAVKAEKQGADYLGVGAVFNTSSKDDADHVDRETLKAICNSVKIPVIAIGGITEENVIQLKGTGICGVAIISAIFAQKNIKEASLKLKNNTLEAVK